uniref:Uncharacterized protein n=1 Tax=Anguilla anguilla TaxID=7936 RepID=A0A0E9XHQ3_ANGAN
MIKVKIKNKQKKILQLLKISTFCVHIHTTWPNYEKQAPGAFRYFWSYSARHV